MLHVASAHASPRWIEIQQRHLREHLPAPFRTWGSVANLDPSWGERFDTLIAQKGPETGRLNHLAVEILARAEPDDLIMFLAPDAFPVADPTPLIERGLAQGRLLAAGAGTGASRPQPLPCFCVTSARAWAELAGDWSDGFAWRDERGRLRTAAGANLLRRLELTGTPWTPVPRSNPARGAGQEFAIYGATIYHHGSVALSSPGPPPAVGLRSMLADPLGRLRERRLQRRGEELFAKIQRGDRDWIGGLG